nr:unnamed protein product [Spirometra erinaceieuropaei]
MGSEDSEFIVVDDDGLQETKETIRRLNEVINLYKSAHDALVKSNILLQDQLHLALQLVLQRVPPDTESSVENLVKSISESAYTSSDTVRRDYVKNLCSKLVVVNANYQKLAQEFEAFKLDNVSDVSSKPKLTRLRAILRGIETMLPSPDSLGQSLITEASLEEFPGTADDELGELCVLAERISSRLRTHLEGKPIEYKDTSSDSISPHASEAQTTPLNPLENLIPGMNQETILKVIKEEVSNFLQKEMQKTLETQEQPTTSSNLTVVKAATPTPTPTPELSPIGDYPSSPALNAASAARSASTSQPTKLHAGFEPLLPNFDQFVGWPNVVTQPTTPPGPPTGYTPDQETPECPVCNRTCADRVALELHLNRCLSSEP